jgi:hypothetical protein
LEAEIDLRKLPREMEEAKAADQEWEKVRASRPICDPERRIGEVGPRHVDTIKWLLQRAEGTVRDWKQKLPEWNEKYEYIEENYRARGMMMPGDVRSEHTHPAQTSPPASQVAQKKTWAGTLREFGDFVDKEKREGRIPEANSRTHAFAIMCSRYVKKDGSRISAHSVMESLRHRDAEMTPAPPNPSNRKTK